MTHPQRRVLLTACLSHALIHVNELAVPALLLLIQREFGVGDLGMGRIVTIYGLLFGLGALPAGWLADRFGSRTLLVACLWGSAAGLIGMATSPGPTAFTVAAAAMGLALSIYHPAGTSLITHAMPASGRVFALHGMAGNLGVAGATAVAGVLGALFGWRWALMALALFGLSLGAFALRLPAVQVPMPRHAAGSGRWPAFATLLVAAAFLGMVYRGMTTFLPKFFGTRYAGEATSAAAVGGALTTAALLVGLLGMYAAGRAADRGVAPPLVFLVGVLGQFPLLVAVGFAATPLLLPLGMGVAFFHFMTQPVGNQMVAQLTPPRLRGLGYGLYFLMTFGAGSIGATIGGWVSERVELAKAFPALGLLLVPAALAMVVLVRGWRRETAAAAADLQG